MSANKVLITTSSFGAKDKASLDALRDAGCTAVLNPFGRTLTETEIAALLAEHQPVGLIAGLEPLTEAVMQEPSRISRSSHAAARVWTTWTSLRRSGSASPS